MKKISDFIPFVIKHCKQLITISLLIIASSILNLVFPFGIKYLFDSIVPQKDAKAILIFFVILCLTFALRAFITYYQEKRSVIFSNTIIGEIRTNLFSETLQSSIGFIHKKGASSVSSILLNDIQSLYETIHFGIIQGFTSIVVAFLFFSALIFINLELASITFIAVPFFIYFFKKLNKSIKGKVINTRKSISKLNSFFTESMNLISTIRFNDLNNIFITRHKKLNNSLSSNLYDQKLKQGIFMSLIFFSFMISFLIALSYSAYLNISGNISLGDLIAFYIILQGLFQPIMTIIVSLESIQTGAGIFERLNMFKKDIISEKFENVKFSNPLIVSYSDKNNLAIEIKNLQFSYDGNNVIKCVNMEVLKGERVLIVGLNGSGKSSLMKLLMGFYSPYEGDIFILGKNLRQWTQNEIANIFSLVEQDNQVYNNSLRLNIDPKKKLKSEVINNYLEMTNLKQFYKRKPIIEENGKNLSSGEKQRIAILRAIIKNSPIYVFDEPFSNQDIVNINLIQDFLEKLSPDKTFIGITHQLSFARFVDKIFLIDNGIIIETGNHEKLINNRGVYHDLYNLYCRENKNRQLEKVFA